MDITKKMVHMFSHILDLIQMEILTIITVIENHKIINMDMEDNEII